MYRIYINEKEQGEKLFQLIINGRLKNLEE